MLEFLFNCVHNIINCSLVLISASSELKKSLKQAKLEYKKKVERKVQHYNISEVWRDMRNITGYKKNSQTTEVDLDRANEFNLFYRKFDGAAGVCPASEGPTSPRSR